jgi:hypothetical protein
MGAALTQLKGLTKLEMQGQMRLDLKFGAD